MPEEEIGTPRILAGYKTKLEERLERAMEIIKNTPDDVMLERFVELGLELDAKQRTLLIERKGWTLKENYYVHEKDPRQLSCESLGTFSDKDLLKVIKVEEIA